MHVKAGSAQEHDPGAVSLMTLGDLSTTAAPGEAGPGRDGEAAQGCRRKVGPTDQLSTSNPALQETFLAPCPETAPLASASKSSRSRVSPLSVLHGHDLALNEPGRNTSFFVR